MLPNPARHDPPLWAVFDRAALHIDPAVIGFNCAIGDLNRFRGRYRAASAFQGVQFDGLAVDTVDGYSALTHLLLAYSTLDALLDCMGDRNTAPFLTRERRDRALARLRALDGNGEFFAFVRDRVRTRHIIGEVDKYLHGRGCDPLQLAAGVRHAFAHGKLSASPQGFPPRTVGTVCRFLVKVVMYCAANEWKVRIEELASFGQTGGRAAM